MRILLIIISTVLAYFVLYAPQPLLPLFADKFAVSDSRAALLTTATMLPLSIAPLTYGYLLEYFSAVRLLRMAMLGMAVSAVGFACATSFNVMVGVRFFQGLLLPAALTSIMTYISATVEGDKLRRIMAVYITSTIIGGFLGRLLAGVSATFFHWQTFFFILAGSLVLCFLVLGRLNTDDVRLQPAKPKISAILEVFKSSNNASIFLAVFCLFFVFAALLNFIPFRLAELRGKPSELLTGLLYSGYLMGAIASLSAGRITRLLRGEINAMIGGFFCYATALAVTLVASEWTLFFALFAFCGSMFFVHTVAATLVNQGAQKRGIVNGLYVAFYYGGGVLGSFAPGLIYERFGWELFILLLLGVAGLGLFIILLNKLPGKASAPLMCLGEKHDQLG